MIIDFIVKIDVLFFYNFPANTVRVADLDNDGNNDIISGFNCIFWNKNYGNEEFSAHYLLSDNITGFIKDL